MGDGKSERESERKVRKSGREDGRVRGGERASEDAGGSRLPGRRWDAEGKPGSRAGARYIRERENGCNETEREERGSRSDTRPPLSVSAPTDPIIILLRDRPFPL